VKQRVSALLWWFAASIPFLRPVVETRRTQTPISFYHRLRYALSRHRLPYWPVHPASVAVDTHNVIIGIETSPGLMPGCYIQGTNGIIIGDYTQIAAGVKLISANHALTDNRVHVKTGPIKIGAYCWLGANTVILPGVELGPYTIVGAGSIVTKSNPDGYCVIAGNPARIIRQLDRNQCVAHQSMHRYNGFIRSDKFSKFRAKYLKAFE
jgi:acetyltransferase-like isoleucine patch superfamily enzyme